MLSDIKPVWKQSIELEPYSMEYYYTVSMASTHRYLAYQKRIFFSQQKIAISCNKHSFFMHISFLPTFICSEYLSNYGTWILSLVLAWPILFVGLIIQYSIKFYFWCMHTTFQVRRRSYNLLVNVIHKISMF